MTSVADLDTPVVTVDLDIMRDNIRRVQAHLARHSIGTMRISPDGSRSVARSPSFATSWICVPAERPIWPPRPGVSSTLWTTVPVGMRRSGSELPTWMSASSPDMTVAPTRRRFGARM